MRTTLEITLPTKDVKRLTGQNVILTDKDWTTVLELLTPAQRTKLRTAGVTYTPLQIG